MNSNSGDDLRWRRRGTPQQNAPGNPQQGQRRNHSHDRNSYSSTGGYQSGSRDGGNAWGNRGQAQSGVNQSPGLVEEHIPVRGFNSREVSEFLNRGYVEALNAAQNPYADEGSKPIIYKSPENPWKTTGKASGGPWGSRQHVMANGNDFLSQLRKGVAALPKD
ncbi:hypothetical protein BDZ91DRAFT_846455 [Kalaharituber pfeilii]|nr:hypothetical protein BDZ91DRAFT_846455 [Kalaharituber pfeilii]